MANKYPPIVQVDDFGKIIGPINYEVAHSEKEIRHATVNIFLFGDHSYEKIMVSLRGYRVSGAGKWDSSAGGHINWLVDENRAATPEETIHAEIKEELFFNRKTPRELLNGLELICAFPNDENQSNKEFTYLFRSVYPGPFFHNPDEVRELKFVGLGWLREDINKFSKYKKYTKNIEVCLTNYFLVQKNL